MFVVENLMHLMHLKAGIRVEKHDQQLLGNAILAASCHI